MQNKFPTERRVENLKKVKTYIINQETVLLTGEYDQYGKLCTRVIEGDQSILVDHPPLKVISKSINYFGFSLKGAIEGAKTILGKVKMCPIMICPVQDICMFPHTSPVNHDCIWFNHSNVLHTQPMGRYTLVELSNGRSIKIQARHTAFNNKKQKAGDLRRIIHERSHTKIVLYLEPKQEYERCKETGRIHFEQRT